MQRLTRWLTTLTFVFAVTGCGGGGGGGSEPPVVNPPPATATAQLTVSVFDTLGRAVEGATLKSAAASATTGADGRGVLAVPTGNAQVVAVEKSGFAEQVRRVELATGTTSAELRTFVVAREAPMAVAAIDAAGSVVGKHGLRVAWPAGAFVDSGGRAATGAAQLQLTPLDVSGLDLGAFPGAFEGTATGASAPGPLLTHGSAELLPQQGGTKLQLAAGKQAEIDLPVYVALHPDGSAAKAGDVIALWSLDAATGLWRQEGSGILVTSADSPTGLVMRASIGHFSWWNIDSAVGRATVSLTVQVPGQTVPAGTRAKVEARIVAGSGPTSVADASLVVGVAKALTVPAAPATTRFSATVDLADRTCNGQRDVASPAAGATVAVVLDATSCQQVSVPRIVAPAGEVATNSSRAVRVQVLIDGNPVPDLVEVFANGVRFAQFPVLTPLPWFTAFFDTASLAEGRYSIVARATRQGQVRNSSAVAVVVDRTPPTMVQIDPAPGSEVAAETVFNIAFSEPVTAFPFALADVVKLAVTPLGGGTPQVVPARVEFAPFSPQRLVLTPLAVLPLGTASVSWAGLADAAGNAVAGTVAATYPVARMTKLYEQAVHSAADGPQLAIASDGRIVLAWAEADGNLRVGVHSGGAMVLFGAPSDNPVAGPIIGAFAEYMLALDAADRPVVAIVRNTAAGIFDELVVRRFENGAWVTLGNPFVDNGGAVSNTRLLIDSQGRLVLGYIRGGLLDTQVYRFTAAGGWASLGAPGANLGRAVDSGQFDLALTPDDRVVIALLRADVFGIDLRVARLDGSNWTPLGGVIDGTTHCGGCGFGKLSLTGGSDGPWLHYTLPHAQVSRLVRFDGANWPGSALPVTGLASAFALQNGVPIVAAFTFDFSDNSARLHLSRFVNGAFEPPFTTGGGTRLMRIVTRGNRVVIGEQTCCSVIVRELR